MDAAPPDPPKVPEPNPFEPPRAATPRKGSATAVSFLGKLAGALFVVLASSIAFVATCYPIGLIGMSKVPGDYGPAILITACTVGGVVAIGVGYLLSKAQRWRRTVRLASSKEAKPR